MISSPSNSYKFQVKVFMTVSYSQIRASLQGRLVKPLAFILFLSLAIPQLFFTTVRAGQKNSAVASSNVAQTDSSAVAAFEEIPASASGITWVHDNAMSEQRYLPETLGPGGAFFDYDNDGW